MPFKLLSIIIITSFAINCPTSVFAGEIYPVRKKDSNAPSKFSNGVYYLKNGDRISGEIIQDNGRQIKIKTEAMGIICVDKKYLQDSSKVEEIDTNEEIDVGKRTPKLWETNISLGFNKSGGNTQQSQLAVSLYANRKTQDNEITLRGRSFYSSSNTKMDAQRYFGSVRYAFSFGERLAWYNFYKLEAEHDRFANVDYRLLPSLGIGYWFSDEEDWKLMVECGTGYEHTDFKTDDKDRNEVILIPRVFFEKKIFAQSRISQDLFFYPSLTEFSQYRLHSETSFLNPINDRLAIRLSFIDDYNCDPAKDTKKNDFRLISSLEYSF